MNIVIGKKNNTENEILDSVLQENNDNNCLELYKKYEVEEYAYRLCFYQLFNGFKNFPLESFEIVIKEIDKSNQEINI